MEQLEKTIITVEAIVHAPKEKVWLNWTLPLHIIRWNNASEDWHTPFAENDCRKGGRFKSTMAAKDGSMSFDFTGIYTEIREHELIQYTLDDGRKVKVEFSVQEDGTKVSESFEAENENSHEMQRAGWQAILNNFKRYVEQQGN